MNFLPSKKAFRKYIFEIIIIFVGITLGFLFDEWRDNRAEEKERSELKQSMRAELIRIKLFFLSEDSSIHDQLTNVKTYLAYKRNDTSTFNLVLNLTREVSYLEGTFSHVNALARDNANRVTSNLVIAQNLSFLGNMENDLSRMKDDTRQIILKSLWSTVSKYKIDQDIYSLDVNDKFILNGNYKSLILDHAIESDLRLLAIKFKSLSGLNVAIINRIDDIVGELDKSK